MRRNFLFSVSIKDTQNLQTCYKKKKGVTMSNVKADRLGLYKEPEKRSIQAGIPFT